MFSSFTNKDKYFHISLISILINLWLAHISLKSSKFIFPSDFFTFNKVKIFLNCIKELLSKYSYSSIALCLYLFKANLFPDLDLIALLERRDKRVNNKSLLSFLSAFKLDESSFHSSKFGDELSPWFKKSFRPFFAPSQSIFESLLYLYIKSQNVSFSSSVLHKSSKSIADKKESNSSREDRYGVVSKNFSIFVFNCSW